MQLRRNQSCEKWAKFWQILEGCVGNNFSKQCANLSTYLQLYCVFLEFTLKMLNKKQNLFFPHFSQTMLIFQDRVYGVTIPSYRMFSGKHNPYKWASFLVHLTIYGYHSIIKFSCGILIYDKELLKASSRPPYQSGRASSCFRDETTHFE